MRILVGLSVFLLATGSLQATVESPAARPKALATEQTLPRAASAGGQTTLAPVTLGAIATVISLASLLIVAYKEFWQGPRLSSSIDQLILLRVPTGSKSALLRELLLRDLLSGNPSAAAASILASVPGLAPVVAAKNRSGALALLDAHMVGRQVVYNPPGPLLDAAINDPLFPRSFGVPLIIANSGRKVGHVGTMMLVLRSVEDHAKKWLFIPLVLLDDKRLIQRSDKDTDASRMAGMFLGVSVHPLSTAEVLPMFGPQLDIGGKPVQVQSLTVGRHQACVIGYGGRGKVVFRTNWVEFELRREMVVQSLGGADAGIFITGDEPAKQALRAK